MNVPKIGFVNDIVDINICGKETLAMNYYTRDEMNKRKMQLSFDKCARMHIKAKGEKTENERCAKVVLDEWKEEK